MNLFAGTGVALVTPFDKDFGIDEASLRKLIEYVIAGDADYLVALGTTSEAATLSEAERYQVMEVILEQNQGRLPVMVGIGGKYKAFSLFKILQSYSECHPLLQQTFPGRHVPPFQGIE